MASLALKDVKNDPAGNQFAAMIPRNGECQFMRLAGKIDALNPKGLRRYCAPGADEVP